MFILEVSETITYRRRFKIEMKLIINSLLRYIYI